MNPQARQRARELVRLLAPNDYDRLVNTGIQESSFGYDPFGLERESVMLAFLVFKALYKRWFRVESSGAENVPLEGPVLLTPNHSGVFPIDGAMIAVDLCTKLKRPRIMRAVVDNFACCLPFINTFFARCGQVHGARGNVRDLLKQGEMVTLFPEGNRGTGKRYRERYKLRPFNVGFMELSLMYKAPIVPAAVIGAEEQYPYMFNIKPLAKALHFPYLPVTPLVLLLGPVGLLPLPTKYFIRYGEPLHFYREYPPEAVENVETVRNLVDRVRGRVQDLIEGGLRARKCVFGLSLPPLRKPLSIMHTAIAYGKKRQRQGGRPLGPEERGKSERAVPRSDGAIPAGRETDLSASRHIEWALLQGGPALDWVECGRRADKEAGTGSLRWRLDKGGMARRSSSGAGVEKEASPTA